ncbi:MAG: class I SAM-dependent methyltransferase [Candidatus Rokubacteria bacterium]|nr:class I SAM-dependent methyltransferase [Candidatus Rokubacteria bacterium]
MPKRALRDRVIYGGKLVRACRPGRPAETAEMIWTFRTVAPFTGVDVPRLRDLWRLSRKADERGLPGALVQCGTWNGGSAGVIARASRRSARPLWLFDSFEGFPAPTPGDKGGSGLHAGDWRGTPSAVAEVMRRLGVDARRLRVRPGWFKDTLPAAREEIGPIALLSIDADLYQSVKESLQYLYDLVVPGGYVVLDDYGFWPGCRRAVYEFFVERDITPALVQSDVTGAWFEKPAEPTP